MPSFVDVFGLRVSQILVIKLIVHFLRGFHSDPMQFDWKSSLSCDQKIPSVIIVPTRASPCTEVNLREALDLCQLQGELMLTADLQAFR